jgi:diguanylate cyclase (GGDEF)-like protein/PAS domain S-box-containing protein
MQTKDSFPVHREFLKLFLPAGILFLFLGIILGMNQREAYRERIALQQQGDLKALARGLESEIRVQMADTAFLAEMVEVELPDFADRAEGIRTLSEKFLVFARTKGAYDQVRYLNAKGMEVIRVQSGPEGFEIAPPERLQDKSGHSYFAEAMDMDQEVYVSRFDLNREMGQIDRPLKPVLRFSASVSGREGAPPGVLVLNFLGKYLLDEVRQAPAESGGRFFLVNPLGEFLVGPTPKDEWAMLLGDKTGHSFSDLYPAEWLHIQQYGSNQFLSSQGLMAYKLLHPFAQEGEEGPCWSKGKAKEFWTLVSLVEEARLTPSWWRPAIALWVGLFLLLGVIFWLVARAKAKRVEMLRELAENEKKFRTVTDVAQDAIIMIDSTGSVALWNPAAEIMFGYSEQEVLGKNVHDLLVTDELTRKRIKQSMEEFARTGQGAPLNHLLELTTKRKNNETFHAELSIAPFQVGNEWRAVGTIRDITQRKKAEEELRSTSGRLTLATQAGQVGVWEWDIAKGELHWDERMLEMYKVNPEDFHGAYDTWVNRMHPDDIAGAEQALRKSLGPGGKFEWEFRIIWPDGEERTIDAAAATQFDKDGTALSMTGVNWDITERKRMEEELRRLATTDALTGLFNRRRFIELAEREFSRTKRYGDALSLIMLDADKFKNVNDTYGHDVGDLVLKALASAGCATLRDVDAFGRVGGEEFLTMLPSTPLEGAVLVAEKLRRAIENAVVPLEETDIRFTVSLGVTTLRKDTTSVDQMLKEADQALYSAKENGRNRVEVFSPKELE